jgi:formylglycine-generating enzyme required for sulfatase activity
MDAPRCFISYSWDSEPHKAWVRKLATRLRDNGIDAILDQFHCKPGMDLTEFMEKSVRESSFVLLVCTPTFAQKANAGAGGVGYEKAIVTGEIFTGEAGQTKFIPVLREGEAKESLPSYLKSRLFVDFRDDTIFENRLEELLRHFYDEPLHPAPPIGPRPQFGMKPRFTNSIGMEFVLIPAGSFTMGSQMRAREIVDLFGGFEEKWYKREKPEHIVKIGKPFYLQTTPVTQGQWQKVMKDNPSRFQDWGDNCPVEYLSWENAHQFIEKLNLLEKMKDYRLPTEAEWEYACRAGSKTEYSFGDDPRKLIEFGWYLRNSESRTHPVGEKEHNALGLYDMHGNVWEWTEDDWHNSYNGAPNDGSAWIDKARGSSRVMRGGSWGNGVRFCRSAMRVGYKSDFRSDDVGFRLAMSIGP